MMLAKKIGLATMLSCMLAAAVDGQTRPTGIDDRRQAAATLVSGEIERFTGPVERHCGIFVLPADSDGSPAVVRRQVETAVKCARNAKRRGQPSWAIWQIAGVDATAFAGLAVTPVSDVHLVDTGSVPSDVNLRPCVRPRVLQDGSIVCRNVETDAASLGKALAHLHNDVRRTMGKREAESMRPLLGAVASATPSADEGVRAAALRAGATLKGDRGVNWPVCPLHRDHSLVLREQHWLCERDHVFVAPLGRLPRLRPARPLP